MERWTVRPRSLAVQAAFRAQALHVAADPLGVLGLAPPQRLARGAAIGIVRGRIREAAAAEVGRAPLEVGQGDIGADTHLLQGPDILGRPVGRVGDDASGSEAPAELDPPELVEHRLVLHHIRRRDQRVEDDARLPAVDHVVVMIAKRRSLLPVLTQSGFYLLPERSSLTLWYGPARGATSLPWRCCPKLLKIASAHECAREIDRE